MKILQVTPLYSPYVGGQERYVRSLTRGLVERGHEVEILTSDLGGNTRNDRVDGVKVNKVKVYCRPLNNPLSSECFEFLLRHASDYDIIHTHNEHSMHSMWCALSGLKTRMPFVITCHGQLRFASRAKDLFERVYSKSVASWLLRKAAAIVTISPSDKNYIRSIGGVPSGKVHVIPNGINANAYDGMASACSGKWDFGGKRMVLFVGPIIKRKGPHILLQAIPQVLKHVNDVTFVFVGGGDFRETAASLAKSLDIEGNVKFTGCISDKQMYELYNECNLFVLPSYSEALPYTILDAFAFSKPVVSTQIACVTDHLKGFAVLVPPGDFSALADSIIMFLKNPEIAKEYGLKGRKLIETRFCWDSVVNAYVEIYKTALSSN